jgi:tetratricopeptide (TPR) repeat protein
MPKSSFLRRGFLVPFFLLFCAAPSFATGLEGRVVDRGTLDEQGNAKGIPGVQIKVYDGRKLIASATTDSKGRYRVRKAASPCKAVFRARGYQPASRTLHFALGPEDTASHDVVFDRAPREGALGYYRGLARGIMAQPLHAGFFRGRAEAGDTAFAFSMAGFHVEGDTTADYRGAVMELLWAEYLSHEPPPAAPYYLAQALKPLFDSLGWEPPQGMDAYLETNPMALEAFLADLGTAFKDPRELPSPRDVRKAGIPSSLAATLAAGELASAGLAKRKRVQFLARWKKLWGKDLSDVEAGEKPAEFDPSAAVAALARAKPRSPAARYLEGRALFAAGNFAAAAEALEAANKLKPGMFAAARYLEAMALMQLGREADALGRFQALREARESGWKAKAYYGLAVINEREKRHAEAASDLWKSIRLAPDPEAEYLLAEVSLHLKNNAEAEALLERRAAAHPGEHRARYWLGRFAEKRDQAGVAEDHYRKAWEASREPEYAAALAGLYIAREDWNAALRILEPMKARLKGEGRGRYAECLMHTGRVREAAKEFAAAYAASPEPALLGPLVETLLRGGRIDEARRTVDGFKDQAHPSAKLARAKVDLAAGEIPASRLLLEDLAKRESNNPELHFLLGVGHFRERAWNKAKKEFDLALRYRADYLEAIYHGGLALVKTGRTDDARNFFNELAQRVSPEWKARGFVGVGLSFAAEQKPEAAENYYGRSIDAMPTAEAHGLLALSRRRLGGPEHWEEDAGKAYELDPTQPKAILAMGEAHIARGRNAQALKVFQKGREMNPGSCDVLAGLAKSQYLAGKYQASRTTSASAISSCPDEAEPYYYAGVVSDKLRNRKEAEGYFKAYRKAGGDKELLPEDYR